MSDVDKRQSDAALRQQRTLAFCVSIKHADFMAAQFRKAGIAAQAVYGGSELGRAEALEQLREGSLQVLFSVDLFNEGMDLPEIDTVMMLRPTESKILFLQQLGRGLRRANGGAARLQGGEGGEHIRPASKSGLDHLLGRVPLAHLGGHHGDDVHLFTRCEA
mgnify:CR=1 FL=1